MHIGRTTAWAVVVMVAAMGSVSAAADPPALLTSDELKKLVDSGQYRDALKAMIRILELKDTAAAPYNRHDILLLRAECQLQIKETRAALDTLETVRKEAAEAGNETQVAPAVAMALLIQKSPGQLYTPRTGPARKPIPILDRILRKAAYDALFADEFAPLDLKARAALKATTLPPIAEAVKIVGGVRAVERVSTGDNKQTEQITKDLTKQSLKLMGDAIDDLSARTQQVSQSANRIITENVTMTDSMGRTFVQQQSRRKGLTQPDVQTLKGVKAECDKIPVAAAELAQGLGADAAPFKAIATKAQTLKDKANTALTDDYTNVIH